MLTPKDLFIDFIKICVNAGACADEGQAVPVMEDANKGNGMPIDGTCADGLSLYLKDEKFPEEWALWVLGKVGKELDTECRKYFIDKITDPINAMKVMAACKDLTEKEIVALKLIYENKITSEKTGVVVKYVNTECYGKGFISATDASRLKIESVTDSLWKVEGTEADVDAWIAKVSGTLIIKAATAERVG